MPSPVYVSRVNQIDAAQLDDEIYKVLRNQVKRITEHRPVDGIDRWQPEIDALLKLCVWYFSLRRGKSTFGQQLLNLHYENLNRAKSVLYLILTVVPAYARDKLVDDAAGGNHRVRRWLDRAANAAKLLEFVNLLIFLHRGTQPRVVEYLLGIRSRSMTTQKPRNIGYSYMTRELLWHGLMELFTIGLPMINLHYWKHAFKRLVSRSDCTRTPRPFPRMIATSRCAYCNETPIMPMHAGCEHLFCYYCLTAHFAATDQFQCTACGAQLRVENATTYEATSAFPAAS